MNTSRRLVFKKDRPLAVKKGFSLFLAVAKWNDILLSDCVGRRYNRYPRSKN
jgi:hypothetical protein